MLGKKKMAIWILVGVVCIVLACIATYFFIFKMVNPPLKTEGVKIGNTVFTVEIASTTVERARGLSFRDSLADGHGMLFLFGSPAIQSFWMKDTEIPLDMIWIGGGNVLGFAENVLPEPGVALWQLKIYNSPDGTDKVLEVNAGTVAKDNIKVGDAVEDALLIGNTE